MKDEQYRYTYRQGTSMHEPLRTVTTSEGSSCFSALIGGMLYAVGFFAVVAIVYLGWITFFQPVWHRLVVVLLGG